MGVVIPISKKLTIKPMLYSCKKFNYDKIQLLLIMQHWFNCYTYYYVYVFIKQTNKSYFTHDASEFISRKSWTHCLVFSTICMVIYMSL